MGERVFLSGSKKYSTCLIFRQSITIVKEYNLKHLNIKNYDRSAEKLHHNKLIGLKNLSFNRGCFPKQVMMLS